MNWMSVPYIDVKKGGGEVVQRDAMSDSFLIPA